MYKARPQSTGGARRHPETLQRDSGGTAGKTTRSGERTVAPTDLVFFFLDLGRSRLTFLNRRVHDFFGFDGVMRESDLESLLGNIHPEDLARARGAIASWKRQDGEIDDVEFRAKAGRGRWRWMRCRTIGFEPDASGESTTLLGIAEDVTDRRKVHGLSEMATEVAHELSQPLSSIASYALGVSQRLRAGSNDAADLLPILQKISSEALRAAAFVHHLRALASDRPPSRGQVDANDVTRNVLALVGPEASKWGIRIRMRLGRSIPAVDGDRFQIEHVLLNLVRNAFDAIRTASRDGGEVTIRTEEAARGRLRWSVSDSGPGIAPEIAEHMFTPEFTTKPEGMGFGLSICRSIVEAHGGTIAVSSLSGEGATFVVEFPASSPAKRNEAPVKKTRSRVRASGPAVSPARRRRSR